MRLAVLMACHNRRESTLLCIDRFIASKRNVEREILDQIFLVDDGSTDQTSAAVLKHFPFTNVIEGDGSLFWNGGMRLAWATACKAGDWDAYLWINDDTMLLDCAVETMLETLNAQELETGQRGIVVGSCRGFRVSGGSLRPGGACLPEGTESAPDGKQESGASAWMQDHDVGDSNTLVSANGQLAAYFNEGQTSLKPDTSKLAIGELTYGGRNKNGLVYPRETPIPVDTFNGNLVLVSSQAFVQLGNLSPEYRHNFGDFDYGLRAKHMGIPVWLAPGYLAACDNFPPKPWMNPSLSMIERLRSVHGPKGFTVRELQVFQRVMGRGFWLVELLKYYITAAFPSLVLRYRSRKNKVSE